MASGIDLLFPNGSAKALDTDTMIEREREMEKFEDPTPTLNECKKWLRHAVVKEYEHYPIGFTPTRMMGFTLDHIIVMERTIELLSLECDRLLEKTR